MTDDLYTQLPSEVKKTPFAIWCALRTRFKENKGILKTRKQTAFMEIENFKMFPYDYMRD